MIKDYPLLFTIKDSNLRICTQEVQQAIEKAKWTTIKGKGHVIHGRFLE